MQVVKTFWRMACALLLAGPGAAGAQDITLHYFARPPYVTEHEGRLAGLTGAPVVQALHSAGIRFTLQATPPSRFLALMQRSEGPDCGIGWFRNPERETLGKFSKPIYQDEAMVVVTYTGHASLRSGTTLEALLGNPDWLFLAKQAFSYGRATDALIAQLQPRRELVAAENINMLRMLHAHRADYMLMAPEELTGAVAAAALALTDFAVVRPSNMPKGELRYLWCSKAVPDALMARFNAEIR